jgi:L,D-transpeptidase-like protein
MVRRVVLLLSLAVAAAMAWIFWGLPGGKRSTPVLVDPNARAELVLIEKSSRLLIATQGEDVLFSAEVTLGPPFDLDPENQTLLAPTGLFTINRRQTDEIYHLILGLKYPRPEDLIAIEESGIDPGGSIFIHGQTTDRVEPSIGLTNPQIEALWSIVGIGTRVEIRP